MTLPTDDTIPMTDSGPISVVNPHSLGAPYGAGDGLRGLRHRWNRSVRRDVRVRTAEDIGPPTGFVDITSADPGPDASTITDPSDLLEHRRGSSAVLEAELAAVLRDATDRFEFRRKAGVGGFGEVWEAWDKRLGRKVAVKLLRPRWGEDGRFVNLLRQEARVASQLLHPAIVAVYDLGILSDGHPFIVMEYVEGQPWHHVYNTAHGQIPDPTSAFSAMMQLVEGLAFGHAREVAHRDIKPGNVLVTTERLAGREACRVRIVDWGLACLVEGREPHESGVFVRNQVGTPAYLAPEIAAGGAASLTADVYSLGVMLHELLWGRRPPEPGQTALVSQLLMGDRKIAEICSQCLALDPSDRIPRGDVLLRRLRAWWRSWQRSEKVADVVARADFLQRRARDERRRAAQLTQRVQDLRARILPSASENEKLPLWTLEDDLLRTEADLHRIESDRMAALLGALAIDPQSEVVRGRLASLHRGLHEVAEASGDSAGAARHLAALSTFDDGTHRAYIRGEGSISVAANVPTAQVEVRHLVTSRRRLVVGSMAWSGPVGATSSPLPVGRYEVRLTAPGYHTVQVCVRVGRSQCWTNTLPGTGEERPIQLLPLGSIEADEVYIAGGPHLVGSFDRQESALSQQMVWTNGFAMRKRCVTVAEYIVFLDDLVALGRHEEALERAPQQRGAADDVPLYLYGRRADGTFFVRPDGDGDPVDPEHPVTLIRPMDAHAYADWLSARTGQDWRLPFELEWEKAARSADGRQYPFGDHIDASWVRCLNYFPPGAALQMARVSEHPTDRSAHGIEQLAGNVYEMTASEHRLDGPAIAPDGTWAETPCALDGRRVVRGGAWGRDISRCRSTHRSALGNHRTQLVGFRLVRSVG